MKGIETLTQIDTWVESQFWVNCESIGILEALPEYGWNDKSYKVVLEAFTGKTRLIINTCEINIWCWVEKGKVGKLKLFPTDDDAEGGSDDECVSKQGNNASHWMMETSRSRSW